MLSCKALTELVTDHLERELSIGPRMSVSLHLSSCPDCRAYFGQMKWLVKLLRQMPAEPAPPKVSDKLLLFFRRWHQASKMAARHRTRTLQLLPADRV